MVEPQPTKKPEWNTGGSNRTEPTAGEKVTGWAANDEPPSSYFNWLQYYTYAWFEWINERFLKGTAEVDLIVQALQPDTSGAGGNLDLKAGAANTSGAGGKVNITSGQGIGAESGDIVLACGNSDTNGGDLIGAAGDNTSSGIAGNVNISAGDASGGGGGTVLIEAGDGTGNAGSATLQAGNSTSAGDGGALTLAAGDGAGVGDGGAVSLTAGDAGTDGLGGAITIAAGAGTNGNEGGDAILQAGDSADTDGGDATVRAGDASGTDQTGGTANIRTGASTGTAGASFFVKVAEAETGGSGSGTYTNNPVDYVTGSGVNKQVNVNRHFRVDNSSDTTRGAARIVQQAQPTGPLKGDIYLDSNTDQAAIYNGTRYHNLHPVVYSNSDSAVTGETPGAAAATTYVLNEKPYGGSVGTTPLRYIIPANTLRVGSIVRVRAIFLPIGAGSTYPSPKVFVGSIGAGPSPYTAPTGVQILPYSRASLIWDDCGVECDLRVRGPLGASCGVDRSYRVAYNEAGAAVRPVINQTVFSTDTVDTTAALDVFGAVTFSTATGWVVEMTSFIVEVL